MAAFLLAHLSDPHLPPMPVASLRELAGKRVLGYLNWKRNRHAVHRAEVLDALVADMLAQRPDHIAVTGDLVNLSLPGEYALARAWLEALGPPSQVTVIPGNHDIYVPGARDGPSTFWGDYMRGDDGAGPGGFPFIRRRGDVVLIALSSALPTGPFMATGRLGASQLARFAAALDSTRGLFRIVLIHHPPVSPPSRYLRRLTDADAFRRVLAQKGAELVLHGHDHCRSLVWLDGPEHPIPALGAPSGSARVPHHGENAAGYNLLRIDGEPGRWRCELIARERGADGVVREAERRMLRQ
jgi:3',5'-cyclic AMP phosphodiesterase CpdA